MLMNNTNPQAFIQQIMNNPMAMKNPMVQNVIGMMQKNDTKGLEEMARNLYKEKGLDIDETMQKIKSQFGM